MPVTNEEERFLRLGFQYYIAARSAVLAGLDPVCGNLFHHAVEMFLKARLCPKYSSKQLKKQFGRSGHELRSGWSAFKAEFPGTDLRAFDNTIDTLDSFENLRYPDALIKEGAEIVIAWNPGAAAATGVTRSPGVKAPPRYEVAVSNVDLLVARIFEICSRNPQFFTGGLRHYAQEALTHDNPARDMWFPASAQTVTHGKKVNLNLAAIVIAAAVGVTAVLMAVANRR